MPGKIKHHYVYSVGINEFCKLFFFFDNCIYGNNVDVVMKASRIWNLFLYLESTK